MQSSANLLRIRKKTEFVCRPQNGLLLILFKPSKQTAELLFKMDLQCYLRNPSHFKLHNRPNMHHRTPYVSGRLEQHLLPYKATFFFLLQCTAVIKWFALNADPRDLGLIYHQLNN